MSELRKRTITSICWLIFCLSSTSCFSYSLYNSNWQINILDEHQIILFFWCWNINLYQSYHFNFNFISIECHLRNPTLIWQCGYQKSIVSTFGIYHWLNWHIYVTMWMPCHLKLSTSVYCVNLLLFPIISLFFLEREGGVLCDLDLVVTLAFTSILWDLTWQLHPRFP